MALVDLQLRPGPRRLRHFGWIAAGACVLFAGLLLWRGRFLFWEVTAAKAPVLTVLGAIGASSLFFSWKWPAGNRALYVVLSLITYPIGLVVANVLTAAIFYSLITPLGLFFRWTGRDALHRRPDPHATTYWTVRERERRRSRYFQQF